MLTSKNLSRLWCLVFFIAILGNFPGLQYIPNILYLIMAIIGCFYRNGKTTWGVKLLFIYMLLSIINSSLFYLAHSAYEYTYSTIPCLIIAFAADRLFIPNKLPKLIAINMIPALILLLLGGGIVLNEIGRLDNRYIGVNTRDVLYLLAFPTSLYMLSLKKNTLLSLISLFASIIFSIYSGSRKDFIFILFALIFNIKILKEYVRHLSIIKKILFIILFVYSSIYIINQFIEAQTTRFGSFSVESALSDSEASKTERLDFINIGLRVSEDYPLGVGEKNNIPAIIKYGLSSTSLTFNLHSVTAQVLVIGGWIGLLMWIIYSIYLIKLSFYDIKTWYYIPIFIIIASFTFPLFLSKLYWVVLIFFEKEINMRKSKFRKLTS